MRSTPTKRHGMTSPTRRHFFLPILGFVLVALIIAGFVIPWPRLVGDVLRQQMEAQGLRKVHLTVEALGLNGIKLRDISIGDEPPLRLPAVTVAFNLSDLWNGKLQTLHLDGLEFTATQQSGAWTLTGFSRPPQGSGQNVSNRNVGIGLPLTQQHIAAIPLEQATLTHGSLRLTSPDWSLALPLELNWQKQPTPRLTYQGDSPTFKMGALTVTAITLSATITLNPAQKQWSGAWQLEGLALQGSPIAVPSLTGTGTLGIGADAVQLAGCFNDTTKDWQSCFKADINMNNATQSRLTITHGKMPWTGGVISVRNVTIPLSGNADIQIPVQVKGVSIDTLMQQLTGKRATAQGVVSGTLPVTIKANGAISIAQGQLQAEAPGVIAIDPAAIPGDNEQIALVREVLQNLHYTLLAIGIDNGKDNKPAVTLTVEGRNPDAQNGRAVKLQVHLGGDVLEFAQQSLMSFTDPKQLLRQENNAQK